MSIFCQARIRSPIRLMLLFQVNYPIIEPAHKRPAQGAHGKTVKKPDKTAQKGDSIAYEVLAHKAQMGADLIASLDHEPVSGYKYGKTAQKSENQPQGLGIKLKHAAEQFFLFFCLRIVFFFHLQTS